MKNEGLTERLTYELFEAKGFSKKEIIPKKTNNPTIQELLKHASKKGSQRGEPDFFVLKDNSNLVIIVECKPDIEHHCSEHFNMPELTQDEIASYACDGIIHYASFLKDTYDIIAIALSGNDDGYRIDSYLWLKGQEQYKDLDLHEIRRFEEYYSMGFSHSEVKKEDYSKLLNYAHKLHENMRDYANLTEAEKPLLVSGILLALQDDEFESNFDVCNKKGEYIYKDNDEKNPDNTLSNKLYNAIERVLVERNIPKMKISSIMSVYAFIKGKSEFKIVNQKSLGDNPLRKFVRDIKNEVCPYMTDKHSLDVIGKFYGEFIKYTGGDGKGLGIVLTPHHVTDLFCKIADVKPTDKVLDICTGTGAFLIAAMKEEIKKANGDSALITKIKTENLVGCEQQANMFALACSNMILRDDGQSNLHLGSCFDIKETLTDYHCNIGMINPPYSQKGVGLSELDFIKHMLDCLDKEKNSIGIAIVPMSCAIDTNKNTVALKQSILDKHTLRAVMSMPAELFYPVGVVPCIMVFEAGKKHNPDVETWFGYWKEDGFVKTKKDGRIDLNGKWDEIEQEWLNLYRNNREKTGLSVLHSVTASDEWCAEAYMQTDYSKLTREDFEKVVKNYAIFKLSNEV